MTESEQIEHRVGMAELTGNIKALTESMSEFKALLKEQGTKIDNIEQRAIASCKSCDLRDRVIAAERAIGKVEIEMAGFTGRAAGISIAAGALAFLASFFVRKGQ